MFNLHNTLCRQSGFILIESLIVISVATFGFLALNKLGANVSQKKTEADQQTEASIFGTAKMEALRNYSNLAAYQSLATGNDTVTGKNATYARSWNLSNQTKYKTINLTVSWTSPDNQSRSIQLSSAFNASDAKESGTVFEPIPSGIPSPNGTSQTTTKTIPGTNITLTYDNNNNVTLINKLPAISLSGTVTLGTGSTVNIGSVVLNPQSSNGGLNYCYITVVNGTGIYTCYGSSGWSGSISVSGVSSTQVCTNSMQPYSNLTSSLVSQNYVLVQTGLGCPSNASTLLQTL